MEAKKILTGFANTSIVFIVTMMFLISLTSTAAAQDSIDFGSVPLGASVTKSFSITNTDNQALLILSLRFQKDICDFSINTNFLNIEPGQTMNVDVTYSPSSASTCTDIIEVHWGPPIWKTITVTGTGVEEAKDPGKEGLLDTFDKYAASGMIKGSGTGKSADKKLKAYRNMLRKAGELIQAGKTKGACGQLKAADKRMDNFVTGEGASRLRQKIQQTISDLGCKEAAKKSK